MLRAARLGRFQSQADELADGLRARGQRRLRRSPRIHSRYLVRRHANANSRVRSGRWPATPFLCLRVIINHDFMMTQNIGTSKRLQPLHSPLTPSLECDSMPMADATHTTNPSRRRFVGGLTAGLAATAIALPAHATTTLDAPVALWREWFALWREEQRLSVEIDRLTRTLEAEGFTPRVGVWVGSTPAGGPLRWATSMHDIASFPFNPMNPEKDKQRRNEVAAQLRAAQDRQWAEWDRRGGLAAQDRSDELVDRFTDLQMEMDRTPHRTPAGLVARLYPSFVQQHDDEIDNLPFAVIANIAREAMPSLPSDLAAAVRPFLAPGVSLREAIRKVVGLG